MGNWIAKYFDTSGKEIKTKKFNVTVNNPGIPLGEKYSVKIELIQKGNSIHDNKN